MMTSKKHMIVRTFHLGLILGGAALAGCMDIEDLNEPPTARVAVLMNGAPIDPTMIPFSGTPVEITLSGEASSDVDGMIVAYEWWRTDVPRQLRYPESVPMGTAGMGAAGMGAAGMAAPATPPFEDDPMPGRTTNVTLSAAGTYRFSLWATDEDGGISEPASVTLNVGAMP